MNGLRIDLPPELAESIAQRAAQIVLEQLADQQSKPYLTVEEATAYIGATSRQRIYDLRSAGRLTRCGDGRKALVKREELDAYLDGKIPLDTQRERS